jgi:hypothetical protein
MAQGSAELARAVGNIEPTSPEFRLAAEIRLEVRSLRHCSGMIDQVPRQSAAATPFLSEELGRWQ